MERRSFVFLLVWMFIKRGIFAIPQRKKIRMNPLRDPHSQELQNEMANRDNLSRIKNEVELEDFVERGLLIPLPKTKSIKIDWRLDNDRRFCRPWTYQFLIDMGLAYKSRFKKRLQVNSAVRTMEDQEKLRRKNGNAAPAEGPLASSHLTGATVDITKKKMSHAGLAWMRTELGRLKILGLIAVREEIHQPVFHIMVFKKYTNSRTRIK